MKRFFVKWLKILPLIGMTIIFTSCFEMEQDIFYKDGWYHYDCRFSVDKRKFGLFFEAEEGPFADIDAETRELRQELQESDDELRLRIDVRKIDDYTVDMAVSVYKWVRYQEVRDILLPKTENKIMKIPLLPIVLLGNRLFSSIDPLPSVSWQGGDGPPDIEELKPFFSDYYLTIYVEESLLPHRVSTAYLTDEAWERTRVDCEWFGNRLKVKIPMIKLVDFLDGGGQRMYTNLVLY